MSKHRGWVFTLNNYTQDEYDALSRLEPEYIVYGKEVGESGTPHLQGFLHFANPRIMPKKLIPRAHWEPLRGTPKQASDYCKKDGDFYEHGTLPNQGKRNDLDEVYDAVKTGTKTVSDIIEEQPEVYNPHVS